MISVSLTVSHSCLNQLSPEALSVMKVNELLVDFSAEDHLRVIAEKVPGYKDRGLILGASFQVVEDNYLKIPDIVSFCLNNDITRLVFPMQRLMSKENCFYVSRENGKALSHRLNKISIAHMKITIHDPFLWRVFYPAASFPGGGCQAANSMVYIAPDGSLYPCPSMPIALGSLNETPLKEILSSASKKQLVKNLHEPPGECLECAELEGCMGGCSGRVYVLAGTLSQRDPACM
jgi:GeoRSP system SPASM domain protein